MLTIVLMICWKVSNDIPLVWNAIYIGPNGAPSGHSLMVSATAWSICCAILRCCGVIGSTLGCVTGFAHDGPILRPDCVVFVAELWPSHVCLHGCHASSAYRSRFVPALFLLCSVPHPFDA